MMLICFGGPSSLDGSEETPNKFDIGWKFRTNGNTVQIAEYGWSLNVYGRHLQ